MSPRTVERVDDWETVPFGGGYGGLRDLASQEFSGVVTAGPSRLFMIRGTVVGILDGSIEDFEDADGTARTAAHPALPLLAVMQERSDEVRAQYYTEETSIADVNRTLEDGGFTGYVELSENVLSGDYYQVYHQGRSMSVAYVGSSQRLITDDDAFEQANDEVGIYKVWQVDVDAIDVPEPADDANETTQGASTAPTNDDEEASSDDAATETDPATTETDPATTDEVASSSASSSDAATDAAESTTAADSADSDDGDSATSPTTESTGSDEADEPDSTGQGPSTTTADPEAAESDTGDTVSETHAERNPGNEHASNEATSSKRDSTPSQPEPEPSSQPERQRDQSDQADPTSAESRGSSAATQGNANTTDSVEDRQPTGTDRTDQSPSATGEAESSSQAGTPQGGDQRSGGSASTGTASDLEMRSIPSLDPSRTEAASKTEKRQQGGGQPGGASHASQQSPPVESSAGRSDRGAPPESDRATQQRSSQSSSQHPGKQSSQQPSNQSSQQRSSGGQAPEQTGSQSATSTADQQPDDQQAAQTGSSSNAAMADLQTELEEREQELSDLQTDLERVEAERDDIESARDDLEAERDRLQSELEESRAEVQRLEERLEDFAADGAVDADTQLSATEAIDNTNLFVRYRSKGDATLETAHAGDADRAAVAENLRLEYHTQFDAENAAVGNESFDEFLTDTISYRFVEWLVENLLYEIRDTGHADSMTELYNGLPKIDRAELNGQVSVTYTENGDEHRSQERFDIVVRDRMGNPLVVANINDSRDPATDSMMTDLVRRAERVGESSETLAGAFLVTASFFEPEALETADGATSSGLFSRDKRKSFVNLSRKGGYHLCLVEARNQEFHLAVPEL